MKKILLSCVTCLLALGLVTACNNEEEDVNGSDGDTTTQEGGSSDTTEGGGTTQGGDTTEAVTLTNYTVSFSFKDEDGEATTLEEGATLYIIGDWDWITFLPCTEVEGVYSYTFASITVGTHEYKGVAVPDGEDPAYGTGEGEEYVSWEVITAADGKGNATFVVSESDEGGQTIIIEPLNIIEEGTHFYVVFIDDTGYTYQTADPVASLEGDFYFEASAYTTDDSDYTHENNPNIWSGTNYCNATQTTSTDGHVILYSEEAIAIAEDELWVNVHNEDHWMSQPNGEIVKIPTDDTQTYVCVIMAWFGGWLEAADDNASWAGDSISWHTLEEGKTITDFVSTLTPATAVVSGE